MIARRQPFPNLEEARAARLGATRGQRRVVIFTDQPGWHGTQLKRAFQRHGIVATYLSLTRCRLDLDFAWHGLRLPGLARALPDGVFVRGVPGGTLEQVVLRLDFLHALKVLGVPVYNDGKAIERSVDKAMTSFLLKRHGIPTPPTWALEDPAEARALVARELAAGFDVVLKPLFGSQGEGLQRLARVEDVPDAAACRNVYYLQRFVGSRSGDWHDWRIFVINGRAVAAMVRRGETWISNVAQGGRAEAAVADATMQRMAQDAARALDMDYAGVDLIVQPDGRPAVIEVNGIPAWRGLQRVTAPCVADLLVDDFVTRHLNAARTLVPCLAAGA